MHLAGKIRSCLRRVCMQELQQVTDKQSFAGIHMKRNSMSRRAMLGYVAMLGVAAGSGKAFAKTHRVSPVQQPFSDPYLELVRLLKEGAEVEQDLMLQYLYAAFSLKP